MAATRKFSRTREITMEKKLEEKADQFIEGARLPTVGVILVLLGVAFAAAGVCMVMNQVTRPSPDIKVWGGVVGAILGLAMIFYSFGKWSKI